MIEFADAMKNDAEMQESVLSHIGKVLDCTVVRSRKHHNLPVHESLQPFYSARACPLLPTAFMKRMLEYGHCSPCCLLVGVIYLQRINLKCSTALVVSTMNMQV